MAKNRLSDFDILEQLELEKYDQANDTHVRGVCDGCGGAVSITSMETYCQDCGRIDDFSDEFADRDYSEIESNGVRLANGKFYNMPGSYSKTQKKILLDQLRAKTRETGNKIPADILVATVELYNRVQKEVRVGTRGEIAETGKKYIRRGGIKNEILAAIIYFEFRRRGVMRKRREISAFMQLSSGGFSRGEEAVRELAASGKLELPPDSAGCIPGYTKRYFEALCVDKLYADHYIRYYMFVVDLVEDSEARFILLSSQISSKVIGAIWILNVVCGLGYSVAQIEKETANTRKSTFIKFYNEVMGHYETFAHVFHAHKIPRAPM
jgi:hypothetical protein